MNQKSTTPPLNGRPVVRSAVRQQRKSSGLMALEQRFMFDGAGAVDALQTASPLDAASNIDVNIVTSSQLVQAEQLAQKKVIQFVSQASEQELFKLFNGGQSAPDAIWTERLGQIRQVLSQQGEAPVQLLAMDQASQLTAIAAFASNGPEGKPTIFVNPFWMGLMDDQDISNVLIEELGHWMDSVLNPGFDTPQDEGENFARVVVGQIDGTSNVSASDAGWVTVDGVSYAVEFASFNFTNAYEMVYDLNNNTNTSGGVVNAAIDTNERWSDKEQNLHYFNVTNPLGTVRITDGTGNQNFSGNDVSATSIVVGGNTYNGWISRPIKANGLVRGFYFWTDADFVDRNGQTGLYWAQQDGNQDGDSSVLDNRGFLLVVDQSWFDSQARTNYTINNLKDGNLGAISVASVGSSSDRVDSALNSVVTANSAPLASNDKLTVNEDSGTTTVSAATGLLSNDTDSNLDALTITSYSISGVSGPFVMGSPTTITGVGSITINADGSYSFTPLANYNGTVPPISYTLSDGKGGSASAILSITVAADNDGPVAVNDSQSVTEDIPASGNLLTNDTDIDGDTLAVNGYTYSNGTSTVSGTVGAISTVMLNGATVGTLLINDNGSYTFTPASNYTGSVPVITYSVSDGHGGTATATLTLTMSVGNDTPIANPDNASGALFAQAPGCLNGSAVAETVQQGNVLSNDTDPDLTLVPGTTHVVSSVSSGNGNTWNGISITGRYGVLTISAGGAYSYNVDENNSAVKALTATQTLSESFSYTMTETAGGSPLSASSSLKIVIKGANNAPTAVDDFGNAQVVSGVTSSPYDTSTGNVLTNDVDLDNVSLSINNVSTVSSTYSQGAYDNNISGNNGTTVSAGNVYITLANSGSTANAALTPRTVLSNTTVLINGTGNSMTFQLGSLDAFEAYKNSYPLTTGKSYYLYLDLGNKQGFVELGSAINSTSQSVSALTTITGTYGTLQINTNGAYTYTLTSNPGAGTYHDRFDYIATDGSCTSTATLDITIAGTTNLADTTVHVTEDPNAALTGTLTAVGGGAITISSFTVINSDGTSSTGTLNTANSVTGGQLTISSNGTYSFTPNANWNGAIPVITYALADGTKATLNIIVDPVNDAPTGTDKTVQLTDKQTYTFRVEDFGFSDPDDNPSNLLSQVVITTLPSSGTLQLNGNTFSAGQVVTVAQLNSGLLVFTPTENAASNPSTSFTFQVQDNGGTANSGVDTDPSANTLTLNVGFVNDAPVNTLPGSVSTNSYTPVSIAVSVSDPDYLDSARDITMVQLNVSHGVLSLTPAAGVTLSGNGTGSVTLTLTGTQTNLNSVLATLQYTPNSSFSGTDALSVITTDDLGLKDIDSTPITVSADNRLITVKGSVVNEASPYVMFEVSGAEGQWISLSLSETTNANGNATTGLDFLPNLQYFDGTNWVNYTSGLIQIPDTSANNGKLLVRTAILQDNVWESTLGSYETLKLTAKNAAGTANITTNAGDIQADGTAKILDNGQGSVFLSSNNGTSNAMAANVSGDAGHPTYLDDDRPVTVNNIAVNEASPWAMFTVTGYANQVLSLSLLNGTATAGDGNPADGTEDYSPDLEYWDGAAWTAYNSSVTMSGTTLLVRTAIHQDTLFEGQHTFNLSVTKLSSNTAIYGTASIYDDGTGDIYDFDNINDGTVTITSGPGVGFDDDRGLTIDSPVVNEGSNYVVFTLTGNSGQTVSLQLLDESNSGAVQGKADILENQTLKIWDGQAWVNYNADNLPTFDANHKVFVRVDIVAEQDTPYEGGETFKLNATLTGRNTSATGVATIIDDGTGVKYPGTFTNGTPDTISTSLDDDRFASVSVNSISVNEGSPYAVFTVTGAANQSVTLALSDGTAVGGATSPTDGSIDFGTSLQYWNGTAWTAYTAGAQVNLDANGKLLVRNAIVNDGVYEGAHTYTLSATNSGGTSSTGTGTIVDDGTGTYFPDANPTNSSTPSTDPSITLNDDRTVTINSVTVNEGSPYAVFTVTGAASQSVTLALSDGAAVGGATSPTDGSIDFGTSLQYWNGTAWTAYTAGAQVNLDANGKLLVRNAIVNDGVYEGAHTYTLSATNSGGTSSTGTGTIVDDGTGTYFPDANPTNSSTPSTDPSITLNDDRTVSVSAYGPVNEGSPYAMFKVDGIPGNSMDIGLQAASSGKAATISGFTFQFSTDGGLTWTTYDASNKPTVPAGGSFFVRVNIASEADSDYEGAETFSLKANYSNNTSKSAAADSSIIDDGTGTRYDGSLTSSMPASSTQGVDDDRPRPIVRPAPPPAPAAPVVVAPEPAAPLPVALPKTFNSAVQPLANKLAPPPELPTTNIGDILTSNSGFPIIAIDNAPPGLTINKGITDQFVEQGASNGKFSVPYDAFVHSKQDAVISLQAKQGDDAPLPAWVRFDPQAGTFEVNPPANFKGKVELKVVARDDDGREATSIFRLFIGDETTDQSRPQSRNSLSEKIRLAAKRSAVLTSGTGEPAVPVAPSLEMTGRPMVIEPAHAG